MIVVFGIYRLKPRRVAFRNDYCLTCEGQRRAVQVRTFEIFHLYYIPILPLGFWRRWFCATCGARPHRSPMRRPFYHWLGPIVLATLAACFWISPVPDDFTIGAWIIRIVCPIAAILIFFRLLTAPAERTLKEKLAKVVKSEEPMCPFCAAPLAVSSNYSCPQCGIQRV